MPFNMLQIVPKGQMVGMYITNRHMLTWLSYHILVKFLRRMTLKSPIILAPVRDINTATQTEKIEDLKGSNVITRETAASYLKYFYLKSNDKLQYKNGAIIDFSKCFSARKNCFDFLRSKKIIQLKPDTVEKMALKLALYFYRSRMLAA